MPKFSKLTAPSAIAHGDVLARREGRSVSRMPEAGSDQILERSQRIVEAAYELVEEEGLEGFTIRAVLKKSGLSRRAFYERFQGKDDLVLAVFEQSIRLAAGYWGEQVEALADPLERLELIITSIVYGKSVVAGMEAGEDNRRGIAMSREHLRLAESHPEDLQVALQPLISLIADQIADGMATGVIRKSDPQLMAILVYNLVSTTVHTELLASGEDRSSKRNREQIAMDLWEFCRRALIS